jgi:hypothetical protein
MNELDEDIELSVSGTVSYRSAYIDDAEDFIAANNIDNNRQSSPSIISNDTCMQYRIYIPNDTQAESIITGASISLGSLDIQLSALYTHKVMDLVASYENMNTPLIPNLSYGYGYERQIGWNNIFVNNGYLYMPFVQE